MKLYLDLTNVTVPTELSEDQVITKEEKEALENEGLRFLLPEEEKKCVEGSTYKDNSVGVYVLVPTYDFFAIYDDICAKEGKEHSESEALSLRISHWPEMGKICFKYTDATTGKDKLYAMDENRVGLFILHQKKYFYATRVTKEIEKEFELPQVSVGEFSTVIPYRMSMISDKKSVIQLLVDLGYLPKRFMSKWEDNHTIFQAHWH